MSEPIIGADLIVVPAVLLAWWSVETWLRTRTERRYRRIMDRRPAAWR